MARFFVSILVYAISGVIAYLGAGLVHVQSFRALHGLFPNSYQVRQFSIYLLDALPFYLIGVYFVALLVTTAIYRRVHARDEVPFTLWVTMNLFAAVLSALGHTLLFPTSIRAIAFLMVTSIFFSAAYPATAKVLLLWRRRGRPLSPFPTVPRAVMGIATGIVFAVLYVGVFRTAVGSGFIIEEETYVSMREPTPPFARYQAPSQDINKASRPAPYTLTPPATGLFIRERFSLNDSQITPGNSDTSRSEIGDERDFGGRSFRFIDLDGNGFTDIVLRNAQGSLELWLNRDGKFDREKNFLKNVDNTNVHDFYFGDFDNDGKADMLLSRFTLPRTSSFENSFLKQIFWYPSAKPNSFGYLYRQNSLDDWDDVTEEKFPDGAPWAFRKVEPILWFDANADGRLDFIWSQYPHPRRPLNWLYVQNEDGTFTDRFDEFISGTSERVFAEGSDVADYDGDGYIDLFAYGYLYRNNGKTFEQMCGKTMPGMFCDASARNDEGGTFEDFNGDGKLDLALSYHGAGSIIPKYYLQLFRGIGADDGTLARTEKWGRHFYGFHSYLRAKDFDFNGIPDLMTVTPGRLVTIDNGNWVDLMPAIVGANNGPIIPLGWIDIDEDGDWDFLAADEDGTGSWLYRNQYNPQRYLKIGLAGKNGEANQVGATLRIQLPGPRWLTHVHRPMGGYAGVSDPRLIFLAEPNRVYFMEACFASLTEQPGVPILPAGVDLQVEPSDKPRCVNYRLKIEKDVKRVDLTLIAGVRGASAQVLRPAVN